MRDFSKIDLKSLAILVSKALNKQGINAVLVGGACVSIFSKNKYQSYDLDFVSYDDLGKIQSALEKIGFKKNGRYFTHENCPYFIDFVNPPIAVGNKPVTNFETIETKEGTLTLLTPTDCVKDRLSAYYHWNDTQALNQATLVAKQHKIDTKDIMKWSKEEGCLDKYNEFLNRIK